MNKGELLLVYLAIPYSGMKASSFGQATTITAKLMDPAADTVFENSEIPYIGTGTRLNIFSPITHSHLLHLEGLEGDWAFWSAVDLQFIDRADEVWVVVPFEGMQRVKDSVGVQAEIEYAKQQGKPVRYIYSKNIIK